jgi:predicted transcriptional regulator
MLATCVSTHEALQALLKLKRAPERTWSADELGNELNLERDLIRRTLQGLASGGLLAMDTSSTPTGYRYAPESGPAAAADELERTWLEQPLKIISVLNANAIARTRTKAIRAFADAFLIPKEPSDD